MKFEEYPINVSPIPREEGGGYLATLPDLPGCVADGDSIEQAIDEARDAFAAWTAAELDDKGSIPRPRTYSGQFVQRILRNLPGKRVAEKK
ncbi:MAG: type II toxin-antitoxin system HicB family antitoxin [Gammaproteobacteria bacterium]|nr:type II toxin-antitoxin system HicB family antitoxin [Gammaproteobacteria bacterium]